MSDEFESKLAEARRYLDLGYYNKASTCFIEAERKHAHLRLAIEIAGSLVSQGRINLGHEKISEALLSLKDGAEELEIAMAEVLKAATHTFLTGQFSETIRVVTQAYKQHLTGFDVENYPKILVSMELLYYDLTGMASGLGVSVTGPKTDQKKLEKLFHHCVSNKWFHQARRLAKVCAGPVGPILNVSGVQVDAKKFELLKGLVENDLVPAEIRAESLVDLSELVREVNAIQLSDSWENDAKKLFRDVGHACGEDLISLEESRRLSSAQFSGKRLETVLAIKGRLEKIEYWHGVSQATRVLYEVAIDSSDYSLVDQLDQEIDRIKAICGTSIIWYGWQLTTFRQWGRAGPNTARMLPSLEALHTILESTEAFRYKYDAAGMIAQVFDDLGDHKRAHEWKSKVEAANQSRIEGMNHDSFLDRLDLLNKNPSLDELAAVDKDLPTVLEWLTTEAGETVAISERWVAIMKMCEICNRYLGQIRYPTRNLQSIKELIQPFIDGGRSLLSNLEEIHAARWEGEFLSIEAQIVWNEVFLPGPAVNQDLLKHSTILYRKVVDHYKKTGIHLNMAFSLMQLGICHQQVWGTSGNLSNAESFFSALGCYKEAGTIFKNIGNYDGLRRSTRMQLQLWLYGYRAKVELPRDLFPFEETSLFQESENCLKNLERLVYYQRQDLSALPIEQALLAKQKLRNSEDTAKIYDIGITLYELEKKPQMVWDILQRSKARSVSDLLGLGINVPQILQRQINESPIAQILLAEEANILEQISQDKSAGQFQLRRKLEAHHLVMRKENCIQELLDFREGTPVTSAKLQDLGNIQNADGSKRQIFFADWFIHNGKVRLTVLTPDSNPLFDLGVSKAEIEKWREINISGQRTPLFDGDLEPLQELSKLVEPLVDLCNEGDLLVLCPSDSLHYIPIHAATISEDSEISLIERNPVVYCPSMTVFDQCVTRATSRCDKSKSTKQSLLAVYEKPDDGGWQEVRNESYAICRKIATELGNCAAFTGSEVDKSRFQEACETADVIHFIGHCNSEDNALKQHLIISATNTAASKMIEDGGKAISIGEINEPPTMPEDAFTISDMFATHIQASHFDLIACKSASQSIIGGDEPWGIVMALLCAGGSSVAGTQWEIEIGTARKYFSIMYRDILRRSRLNGEGMVVDLAVALQKTVKKLKNHRDYEEPFHWAPFVLHGSWFTYY